MLDRSMAPAIQQIEQVSIPQAAATRLDNEIPLFYVNAGQQPVMRLELVFGAGKWYEDSAGHSYFTGKMLTEGTKSYSAVEIARLFDEMGAFVEVSCGFDRVTLTLHLLSRQIDQVLPIVGEMIKQPTFNDSDLQDLQDRRKQSLLVDLEKNSFVAAREFTQRIFGEKHPYGRVLDIEDIASIKANDLRAFHSQYMGGYFEIILSGMIVEQHLESINRTFGQRPTRGTADKGALDTKYVASKHYFDKEDSLQSSIRLGMPFINRQHPDYLEMLVVNEILGGYFGSRLMSNIREDKGFTYGIRSSIRCLDHGSIWVVSTDVKKQYRDQTLEEIDKEIERLHTEPVPESELLTVKNYMLGTFVSSLNTPFALADRFKTIHYSGLDYQYYQKFFETINKIDSERIQQLSRKYLRPDTMTAVVVG